MLVRHSIFISFKLNYSEEYSHCYSIHSIHKLVKMESSVKVENTEETYNVEQNPIVHVRAKTLALHWHENASAIYTLTTQPGKPGERSARLVTGGGDNNARIWSVDYSEDGNEVVGVKYLSSITKHTQAVNCVRFNNNGKLLATASDDGTIMIWELSDKIVREFGQDVDDDIKESWVMKVACFSSTMSEIYDICWSPDSKYICCGLMDNIIRIFSVETGVMVKQIAEHSNYVQGVAWDPRGNYICSQSADRSVHVYKISTGSNGELNVGPTAFYKSIKGETKPFKIVNETKQEDKKDEKKEIKPKIEVSNDTSYKVPTAINSTNLQNMVYEPIINTIHSSSNNQLTKENILQSVITSHSSASSTMMEPPAQAPRHKRTYSNSSTSSSHSHISRCISPSPMPLPAVMPSSPSHKQLGLTAIISLSNKATNNDNATDSRTSSVHLSANTSLTSVNADTSSSVPAQSINTSNATTISTTSNGPRYHYLYHNETLQSFFRRLTFSPDGSLLITTCGIYKNADKKDEKNNKEVIENTVYVYIRAGLNRGPVVHLPGLKKPAIIVRFSPVRYSLIKAHNEENVFNLKYRMLFAIATQDSILVYDTQRLKCVAIVTGIHYAVITDIVWSSDGRSIFVSSNDGFISCAILSPELVGDIEGGFEEEEMKHFEGYIEAEMANKNEVVTKASEKQDTPKKPKINTLSTNLIRKNNKASKSGTTSLPPPPPATTAIEQSEQEKLAAKEKSVIDLLMKSQKKDKKDSTKVDASKDASKRLCKDK